MNSDEAKMLEAPVGKGRDAEEQAAAWAAYLYSGQASEEGRRQFSSWLKASGEHARAYLRVEQWWRDFDLAAAPRADVRVLRSVPSTGRQSVKARRARKWQAGLAVAASLLIAAGIWRVTLYDPAPPSRNYASRVGEIKTVTLADGSTVTLGGASTIVASISRKRRTVELAQGRAYFDVVPMAGTTFTVKAAGTRVEVIGTAFDISKSPRDVRVSVSKGIVAVSPVDVEDTSTKLQAGQRISASLTGEMGAVQPFDPNSALAWREGRLEYVDMPLSDVVAEVNRYRTEKILLMDETLGEMQVTIAIPSDRTDVLLTGLEATAPVTIDRSPMGVIIKSRRTEPK